jgi:hypothetical protein
VHVANPNIAGHRRTGVKGRVSRAEFRGTYSERRDLEVALQRHCTCGYPRCAVHDMAMNEQRALDGLLFVRRALRPILLAASFLKPDRRPRARAARGRQW